MLESPNSPAKKCHTRQVQQVYRQPRVTAKLKYTTIRPQDVNKVHFNTSVTHPPTKNKINYIYHI